MSLRFFILVLLEFASFARGDETSAAALIQKPESGLLEYQPATGPTLAPKIDGVEVSFAAPEILIDRTSGPVEFVAAIWKDEAGRPIHQREVLSVKPDYAMVVDYLYETGRHAVVRSFVFSAKATADRQGAQAIVEGDKTLRVHALDGANAFLARNELVLSSSMAKPLPLATALVAGHGAPPKIETVKANNPMVVKGKITFADGRSDDIAVAWEVRPLHMGAKKFNGWAVCLRHDPRGDNDVEIN